MIELYVEIVPWLPAIQLRVIECAVMGIFKKLFANKESQFQERVMDVLGKHYPLIQLEPGTNSVRLNGIEISIQKLQSVCEQNQTQADEFIQQYFSYPAALCLQAQTLDVSEIKTHVRPQLVPAEFADRFGVITLPFVEGIAVSLVVRRDAEMLFLHTENVKAAGLEPLSLYEKSIRNLDGDKAEMEITITDGTDRFIGMETHDGFDAARILLPRVRTFAATKLGTPYFGGIPNRNFLILWSTQCSQRFQEYAEEKIETDYAIQPFPLSNFRFEVTETDINHEGTKEHKVH